MVTQDFLLKSATRWGAVPAVRSEAALAALAVGFLLSSWS